MTDQSADLVTKIDVLPDLDGLDSFDAAIDKAIAKVNQLDAAIKRVNNLKPASPYAPSGASAMPTAATTAAVAAITATGANLISRTPLADTVKKEAQKAARAAMQGTGEGVSAGLQLPGRTFAGGGMAQPALSSSTPFITPAPVAPALRAPVPMPSPAPAAPEQKPAVTPAPALTSKPAPVAPSTPAPAATPTAKAAPVTDSAPVPANLPQKPALKPAPAPVAEPVPVIPAPAPLPALPVKKPAVTPAPEQTPTAKPAPIPAPAPAIAAKTVPGTTVQTVGGGGGARLPPVVTEVAGQPAGKGGGLWDPNAGNPMAKYDTSARGFSGEPLDAKKKPIAEGVERATGGGFRLGMDNLLAGAGLTAGIVAASNAMADSLDTIQRQQAQLERLKQTTGDAKDAYFELNRAASDMRSDSGSFISTYTNMATATEKLGFSQERTIKATQGLVGALQLGGGSEEAKSAALYQIGQAFSSDRFGGDEFRSFMEAIGTQAPKVAEAFGTDVKGLRKMSEAGKLTAETMFKAFEKMAASNAELLKKQGWTWGQVTTVMGNDWQAFLAKATIGGEWQRFTDWAANTLIPIVRGAEEEVAAFWSTLADGSKMAILIGILGAVGAAFTALAIPVMAALWPFLAIGAAVWIVYEAFVEWKAWMKGEGGTIFESLFGSFDAFEKRYPKIVEGLKLLSKFLGQTGGIAPEGSTPSQEQSDKFVGDKPKKGIVERFFEYNGNFNPLPGIEKFMGLFGVGDGVASPSNVPAKANTGSTITNSGNTTNSTTVIVSSPKEAAETVNNLSSPGAINDGMGGNIAESTGSI